MPGKLVFVLVTLVLFAAAAGWWLAMSGTPTVSPTAGPGATGTASPAAKAGTAVVGNGWVPPTGEPVERYREARTYQEKYDIISNFIALGHDRNANMLIAALADSDPKIRMYAVESAASMLTPELATVVYKESGKSADPDVRQMTWSFVAPHPMENRSQVYGEVLIKGPDAAIEEVLSEMGRTPEMPLFETLIGSSLSPGVKPERITRIVKELNEWLKPGGGAVPEFKTGADLAQWWAANKKNYDQFMLRVD
jgi:hypothetical protein